MGRSFILRTFESYFRHPLLNLLPLVALLVAAVVYIRATPVYESSGTLYVTKGTLLTALTKADSPYSWVTPAASTVSDLDGLVQTEAFVRSAIQSTPLEQQISSGPDSLAQTIKTYRSALTIKAVGDNIIQVTAKYENAQTARQIADSLLQTYVQWKLNTGNEDSRVAQEFFSRLIDPYQRDLQTSRNAMTVYLNDHPDPVRGERPTDEQIQIKLLQAGIDEAALKLKTALERQEEARLSKARAESDVRQSYVVVDAPVTPIKPVSGLTDRIKSASPFLIVGLLLTIFTVIGAALLDRTFRFAADVQNQLGLAVLGVMPDETPRGRRGKRASGDQPSAPRQSTPTITERSAPISAADTGTHSS